jgi:hypothetical protein
MNKILLIAIALLLALTARAQRVSHAFENVTMPAALKTLNTLQDKYTINFIYDELEDFRTSADIRNLSVPDAIRQLIGFYPITMTVTNDKFISVECTQKTARRYKGRLVDEHREPVAYANVVLLSPADSSIIANGVSSESGNFVIPCEAQCVLVRISYVGYRTLLRTCTNPVIGTLQLQPEARTLGGVVVKGQRPQYKMAKGGMTVDVEHSLLSQAGTASDVLAQLPRVNVDSKGDVSVFAKGKPLVYINSKKISDSDDLKRLKSEDIKSVDIITSPGAQYDSQVKAVIRIKTKKSDEDGFSMRHFTNASYNSAWDGYDQLYLKYRTHGFEISNNVNGSHWPNKEGNSFSTDIKTQTQHVNIIQRGMGRYPGNGYFEGLNMSYDANDSNSVGASYHIYRGLSKNMSMDMKTTTLRSDTLEGSIDMLQHLYSSTLRQEMNVYYVGKIHKLGIDFDGSYDWGNGNETQNGTELSAELGDRTNHSSSRQQNHMIAGKLVLTYPVSKGELTFGSEYVHTNVTGNYKLEEQYVPSSDTKVREDNLAGFAQYSLPLGKYSIDAGVRYEHVVSDYYSLGVWQADASRKYSSFFPNVSLSWNKDEWSWQLNYSYKTQRPSYRNLRNNMQYDSRYLYEGGNPYLRQAKTQDVELNVVHSWLSFDVDYQYVKDAMIWIHELYNNEEIAYATTRNFDHIQYINASVVASPKLGWYQPQYELDYGQQFFNAKKYGSERSFHSPSFTLKLNNRFEISKTCTGMVNATFYTDAPNDFSLEKGGAILNTSLRKSFFNKALTVYLFVDDLFNHRERWTQYGNHIIQRKDCNNFNRYAGFTLTYNFRVTKSHYKGTGAGKQEKARL